MAELAVYPDGATRVVEDGTVGALTGRVEELARQFNVHPGDDGGRLGERRPWGDPGWCGPVSTQIVRMKTTLRCACKRGLSSLKSC
jgi:hypothetical protein